MRESHDVVLAAIFSGKTAYADGFCLVEPVLLWLQSFRIRCTLAYYTSVSILYFMARAGLAFAPSSRDRQVHSCLRHDHVMDVVTLWYRSIGFTE